MSSENAPWICPSISTGVDQDSDFLLNLDLDPIHVGTDPDPRIRTTDLRIQFRIRNFFSKFFSFLLFKCSFTSKIKSQKMAKIVKK
jgi:hypothetical protein